MTSECNLHHKEKSIKEILNIMENNPITVSEIVEKLGSKGIELENIEVSSLLKILVDEGYVIRTVEKKKSVLFKKRRNLFRRSICKWVTAVIT